MHVFSGQGWHLSTPLDDTAVDLASGSSSTFRARGHVRHASACYQRRSALKRQEVPGGEMLLGSELPTETTM